MLTLSNAATPVTKDLIQNIREVIVISLFLAAQYFKMYKAV
jgi:hypothetical protein